jgi:hypothetical protein
VEIRRLHSHGKSVAARVLDAYRLATFASIVHEQFRVAVTTALKTPRRETRTVVPQDTSVLGPIFATDVRVPDRMRSTVAVPWPGEQSKFHVRFQGVLATTMLRGLPDPIPSRCAISFTG